MCKIYVYLWNSKNGEEYNKQKVIKGLFIDIYFPFYQ